MPVFAYPFNPEVNRVGNASWRAFIKQPWLLRRLAEFDLPALIVHGSEDIRPDWPERQLADVLPHARFALIEGAEQHIELTSPEELRERLRSFLRDRARAG